MAVKSLPAVLVVADPAGPIGAAIGSELTWQGYAVELREPKNVLASTFDVEDWEFMIVNLEIAERLPLGSVTDRPYRIILIAPDRPEDGIRALTDLGASAVLETPPHSGLLAATLLTLCRRFAAPSAPSERASALRSEDQACRWQLLATSWNLLGPNGKAVVLTKAEMSFLQALAESPGDAVARSRLIADMGHSVDYYDARRMDTFVSRLRQKVAAGCGIPLPLRSIHAYGYAFAAPIGIVS